MVVTRNGRAVAALLAVRDDEELERLVLAHSPRLLSLLETSRQQIREGEGIRHEDFWREMEEEKTGKGRGKRKRKTAWAARPARKNAAVEACTAGDMGNQSDRRHR
ncbi:MAG TPA: hypothetical protein VFE33_25575 [Thermoanaerobaculia bacterium]|nr:hypothetical protein [Thermoanaerobaculia bacterium]